MPHLRHRFRELLPDRIGKTREVFWEPGIDRHAHDPARPAAAGKAFQARSEDPAGRRLSGTSRKGPPPPGSLQPSRDRTMIRPPVNSNGVAMDTRNPQPLPRPGKHAAGDPLLVIFVRAPRPGTVKTRIAAELGADQALGAYRSMLDELTGRLGTLGTVELRVTPDGSGSELTPWTAPGWRLADQVTGDLTDRLVRAFARAFAAGHERVAVIGSDCPTVAPEDIHAAWQALDVVDLVLGPATDGGYWLIALRHPEPRLFHDIPWSTGAVLDATRARARALGLSVSLLRERHDLDNAADWQAHRSQPPCVGSRSVGGSRRCS